jgi:hypothetical protein
MPHGKTIAAVCIAILAKLNAAVMLPVDKCLGYCADTAVWSWTAPGRNICDVLSQSM